MIAHRISGNKRGNGKLTHYSPDKRHALAWARANTLTNVKYKAIDLTDEVAIIEELNHAFKLGLGSKWERPT